MSLGGSPLGDQPLGDDGAVSTASTTTAGLVWFTRPQTPTSNVTAGLWWQHAHSSTGAVTPPWFA